MFPPLGNNDNDGQRNGRSRRRFLLGVGATAAVAGCIGDSGDSNENTRTAETTDDTPTSEPDDDGTPTTEPTTTNENGPGSLSRAEARRLLPPESLAFRYVPPVGNSLAELWVAVVGETDAAAVRAESESGNYNEVRPQDGTIDGYLGVPVQVDTDGDEVTVFAINDDGASGPVTTVSAPTDDLTTAKAEQAVPPEALSFTYEPPETGEFGSLTIEVTADTEADTLVARPRKGPDVFIDRVGDFSDEDRIEAGTTLDVAVDPDGDEVTVWATVDGSTGEVTRWDGPD